MKPEYVYVHRQSAGQMEAVMLAACAVGFLTAIFGLLTHGWLACLTLLLLSAIALALSRVFALLADLLASASRFEESNKPSRSENADNAA